MSYKKNVRALFIYYGCSFRKLVIRLRLFIAATPPKKIQNTLYYESALLPKGVKRIHSDKIHITLCFFGECKEEPIIPSLSHFPEIKVKIGSYRGFPTPEKAKIIWREVLPVEELRNLNSIFCTDNQDKSFIPHMTVARSHFQVDTTKITHLEEPEFTIRRLQLIESILSSEGATYRVKKNYSLGRQ